MHQFIGKARGGIEPAKWRDGCSGVAGFLFQLTQRAVLGVFSGLELAGAELQECLPHRHSLVSNQHQSTIVAQADHGDRTRMTHDVLDDRLAAMIKQQSLDGEDRALVECGHLRWLLHRSHDRT